MAIPTNIFLYAILDKDNNSYYEAGDGSIILSAQPRFLKSKPIGWKEIELSFDTVDKYFSNVKALSVPLQYVFDGAQILRWLLYKKKGIFEECYCAVFKWNSETGIHELEYKGQIDLSKTTDDPKIGVTVNAKEGGLQSDLDAYESITYELPLDRTNPDVVKVLFDGVILKDVFNYRSYEIQTDVTAANYISETQHGIDKPYVIVPLTFLNNEGDSVGVTHGDPTIETFHDLTFFDTSSNDFFENLSSLPMILNINTDYKFSLTNKYNYSNIVSRENFKAFIFIKHFYGLETIEVANFALNIPDAGTYTIPINTSIEVPANSKLFFVFRFPTEAELQLYSPLAPDLKYQVTFDENIFKAIFDSLNPPATVYALRPLDIANQLVKKWNPKYSVQSDFLSLRNNITATSGQALRGLQGAVLKWSFKDWFDEYNFLYCLCTNIIGNVIYIDRRPDRYNVTTDTTILDLGTVSNIKIKPGSKIYTSVKTGWPDQDYNERNGKYEFNSTAEWKLPVNSKGDVLNLIGKARADCYGIEFIRGKLNNKDTTDNKGDNEVFLVNIDNLNPSGEAQQIEISLGKEAQQSAALGVINFDYTISQSDDIRNYIYVNSAQTSFTYRNATPFLTRFQASFYGNKPAGVEASFDLTINGLVFSTRVVAAAETTFRIAFDVSVPLQLNDVVEFISNNEAVNITTGGLSIQILAGDNALTYNLKRVVYDSITGLPTPNVAGPGAAFNIEEMTPARKLRNWSSYLHSLLFQLPDEKITFQTSPKNKELSTTINEVAISEKADLPVSNLDSPFFLNYTDSFLTKVPLAFSKTLSNLKNAGNVKTMYNGFEIFLLPLGKMASRPATNEAQEWELLLSAYNDLNTLYQLSQEGLYLSDGNNHTMRISVFNPVHFVHYDKQLNARFKYKDIFDDWVHHRNAQFYEQPHYFQKWELADPIVLQFITNGIGQIELYVYDCWAHQVGTAIASVIMLNPAVSTPTVLQQITVNPADYGEGNYLFVLKSNGTALAISEWQNFAEKQDGTYAIDYFNSYNKLNGYFAGWRPMIRLEAMWDIEIGEGSSTDYEDEESSETLAFNTYTNKKIYFGYEQGHPEWMQIKLNNILRLDNTSIEGTHIYLPANSKWEIIKTSGIPLFKYSIDLRRANSSMDFSVYADINDTVAAIYTVDAEAYGDAPGIIKVEIDDN